MLTTRRSATGADAAACDAAGWAPATAEGAASTVPHSEQNFAPGRLTKPQFGQPADSVWPHSMQNFAPARFCVPQLGQFTAALEVDRPPRQAYPRPREVRSDQF